MPLEGSQLDELLSGFLDGELNREELRQIQKLLDERPEVRARRDELSRLSADVKAAFEANRPRPLAKDFASRVVAEAQKRTAAGDLSVAVPEKRSWRRFAAAIAALAAILLLAVVGPQFFSTAPKPVNLAEVAEEAPVVESDASELPLVAESSPFPVPPDVAESAPAEQRFVSNLDFKNHFVLVIDLQMSSAAQQRDALNQLLRKYGLLSEKPIEANEEIKQAVAETRMIVQPEELSSAEASIYFLRSELEVLGAALDEIYVNREDYPKVAFDIAVDNSQARLLEAIAKASGTRFAMNEAFAVPVITGGASSGFNVPGSVRFVSSGQRRQGFGASAMLPSGDELSTVMILVRDEY